MNIHNSHKNPENYLSATMQPVQYMPVVGIRDYVSYTSQNI